MILLNAKEESDCHKNTSEAPYFIVQCMLGKLHSIGRTVERSTTEKNDKCRTRTDDKCICKTPKVWIRPCLTGCDTYAVAAALGAEPIPASLLNSPV